MKKRAVSSSQLMSIHPLTTSICSSERSSSNSSARPCASSAYLRIPLLRPFGCASDGEGGPAPVQAKHRAPGRALPSGWWITVALLLGVAFWVGLGLWLAEVLR